MNKNNNTVLTKEALVELQDALENRRNADRARKTAGSATNWEQKAAAEIAAANASAEETLTSSEELAADAESKLSPEALRSMSESFHR